MELDTFDCRWLPLASMRKVRRTAREFYESPAAIGCALAMHRELYDDLRGFDPHMRIWGVEDLDFSLKCWLMGHAILHDPNCRIGHRFRQQFDNYEVPVEAVLVNKLRMTYKNFTQAVWSEWLERGRSEHSRSLADHPEGLWACAWDLFRAELASADQERAYLHARRTQDEFWYAKRFALSWPRLGQTETLASAPASIEMQMAEMGSPSPPPPEVELRIHNGLYDWVENQSWSGGQEITGADKVNKGAVTVANLNDTNGDGTPDLDQVEVARIGPVGRNEIDLCKLIIAKPDPDQGGSARLTVRKTGVEQGDIQDHVKVWEQPTKKLAFDLPNGTRAIPTDQLDKTLYVEMLRPSNALRDIEFEVEYKGVTDRAKATAVWVEKTARAPWHIRQDLDGFPENPVPGPNQDLPDLTKATVIQFINDNWPNGFIAAAGSRYGYGTMQEKNGVDLRIGGRILFEFEISPPGAGTLWGPDQSPQFDVCRQLERVIYTIFAGNGDLDDRLEGVPVRFPWLGDPKGDNELPNDDPHGRDEQSNPVNNHLYSFDGPSVLRDAKPLAFLIRRVNYLEWVRLQVHGREFPAGSQNEVLGSRVSAKTKWHMLQYLKRGDDGSWIEDTEAVSYSAPRWTRIQSNGTVEIKLLEDADTEGFAAIYFAPDKEWELKTTASGGPFVQSKPSAPEGTRWEFTVPNKVQIIFTQGSIPFESADHMRFSIFKTKDPAGKRNEVKLDHISVWSNP